MNNKYKHMTKAELIKKLEAFEAKQRAPSKKSSTPSRNRLLHELQVHQAELEAQNQELRDAHQLLEESRDRYADLYDLAPVGYLTLDGKGLIKEMNLTGATMLGVERARLTGLPLGIFISREDKQILREHLRRCKEETGPARSELCLTCKDGEILWVELYTVPVPTGARQAPLYFTALTDITTRKEAEEQLKHLNAHDALTGLYNRAYFDEEMARFQSGRQFPISVVMADVDNLKQVNDRSGHAQGDEFLRRAAQVFKAAFRTEDVVARIGGDEFAALLPGSNIPHAEEIVQRVRTNQAALNATGLEPPLSLSLGSATARKGDPLVKALKQADERMYREKGQNPSARHSENNHAILG